MKKSVIFTGAGMSASFGYPLTRDLLPLMVKGLNDGTLFKDLPETKTIKELYRTLLRHLLISLSPGIAYLFDKKYSLQELKQQLPIVTDLLSQLEYQIASGHTLHDWNFEIKHRLLQPRKLTDRWQLSNLKTLFDWGIIEVIESTKSGSTSTEIDKFMQWVKRQNKGTKQFVSMISTNYDVAFEWELLEYGQALVADQEIDYGVSWRDPVLDQSEVYKRPVKPSLRILKLHGSTDWLKCRRCGFLYINPTVEIYTLSQSLKKNKDNSCHCGYWPLEPVLVTMSYVREMEEPNLMEIWRNSFEELRTADEWIIVGYSLPPEDFDIRSLFLRAMLSNDKDLRIKVIQLDCNSQDRYDRFFGKNNYEYLTGGFEANIHSIIKSVYSSGKKIIKAKKF